MGDLKWLGKKELRELGCNFIVVNVPVFAATADANKVHLMESKYFTTLDEVKEFFSKNMPLMVFDQTGVYKDKAVTKSKDGKDWFVVRCFKISNNELEVIKANLRETESIIFSFKVDMDCWFPKKAD
jgi:hypothetical protein